MKEFAFQQEKTAKYKKINIKIAKFRKPIAKK